MTVVSLFCFLVGDVDPGLCREKKKDAPSKPPSSVSDMTAPHTHTVTRTRTQTQLFSWRALLASVCCSLCSCCCCRWCVSMCVHVCVCVAVQSREDSSAEQSKAWLAFSLFVWMHESVWFLTLGVISSLMLKEERIKSKYKSAPAAVLQWNYRGRNREQDLE